MVDAHFQEDTFKPTVTRDEVLTMTGIGSGTPKEVEKRFLALGYYVEMPVPDRVTHLWRYSDPNLFFPRQALTPPTVDKPPVYASSRSDAVTIHLLPGTPPGVRNSMSSRRLGITVEPLRQSPLGLSLIGSAVALDHGIFESLGSILWSTGVFISIDKGVRLDAPIRIVHHAELSTNATRVVVHAGAGADVRIVEQLDGGGADRHVLSVTEAVLEEGARAEHAVIQGWASGTVGHVTNRARLGRDAVWQSAAISLGGKAYKADFGAVLAGTGAESNVVGVSLSRRKQHMDFHTVHHHVADRTRSKINFKTALAGKSTAVYTGLIRMEEGATQSEAFQENRNLMLSDKAKSHAIPELEIMTSDVQCSHAATSAPLNEEELFYLRSRGIPEQAAEQMLVRGFFEDALGLIPEGIKPDVETSLSAALGQLTERRMR